MGSRDRPSKEKKKPKAKSGQPKLSPLMDPPANVEVIRKPRKEKPSGTAGGKFVYVDRVELNLALRDAQAQVNALAKGEIDVLERPAFESYEQLRKADGVVLVTKDPLGFQYMGRFNHLHPPFNNPKARQALALLVDQAEYAQAAYGDKKYWRTCMSMLVCGGW